MSLAPISSVAVAPAITEGAKPAPATPVPQQPAAVLKPDTVTVSAAGHAAAVDGDHDGH